MFSEAEHGFVREQLTRLLDHPYFAGKTRLRDFLRFVVERSLEGDLTGLKETLIGIKVYGRDPSYDPKESPIVRTEARRLRALLESYYASSEGAADPVVVQIPKGAYVASFDFRVASRIATDVPEQAAAP